MDRFMLIMEGLCRAVAAGRGGMAGPLIVLVWGRLQRMARRLVTVVARAQRGARPAAVRRMRAARPRKEAFRFSREFAWLLSRVPGAASSGSQLENLLRDPEMQALLAAAPGMGRVLRPLCRMLGVRFVSPPVAPVAEMAGGGRPVPCGPSPAVLSPGAEPFHSLAGARAGPS